MSRDPQELAADPQTSAFVTAHAGTGKTFTLVSRVARLLLRGAAPEAVLCVTYTKAAAAEMQRRLFETLGGWSVMADGELAHALHRIGEDPRDLARARTLFARALETPGGLKIQTLHAFCEKLLRRFPLEAGVSPGFRVMEEAQAHELSARARQTLAHAALADPEGPIGRAYAHLSVELDLGAFEALVSAFEGRREAIGAYADACGGAYAADVWRVCGFPLGEPLDPEALEAEAVAACAWERWAQAAQSLAATGKSSDAKLAERLKRLAECAATSPGSFADCLAVFSTGEGAPTKQLGTRGVDPRQLDWLLDEQARLHDACARAKAARMAVDTVAALDLAIAYRELYDGEKGAAGALDFADLTARTLDLLRGKADAAWVLYKLDGGIDHVLVDEAQDTAPEQWEIVRALTGEFFAGHGVRGERRLARTVFAVGDEKQSIYSFQGAAPEQFLAQAQAYAADAAGAGAPFAGPALETSFRSTREVLRFVDAVFDSPAMREAVAPPRGLDLVSHTAHRKEAGQVDLWPTFQDVAGEEPLAWDAPLDTPGRDTARKRLARRIAAAVQDWGGRGEAVWDKDANERKGAWRPIRPGDVLILVRRRDGLFEEIIRALKKARVPVAGADRLRLSQHIVFQDVLALLRFALFPWDDLTVATLLRSPFCGVDEEGLYALAHGRAERSTLYAELNRRGDERPDWDAARRFLGWARDAAHGRGPFDFLGRVMSWLDGEGRTQRQRIVTRLGSEAEDALEEILSEALRAEARGTTDLERFAAELERADLEVKRELEGPDARSEGQVRVMTVHGAKGLEAPVVILPDTCGRPPPLRTALMPTPEGGFLFAPREKDDTPASAAARAVLKTKAAQEGLRLLYVALTRARDRVVVTGRLSARDKGPPVGGWYATVAEAFAHRTIAPESRTVDDDGMAVTRFGPDPLRTLTPAGDPVPPEPDPAWLRRDAPAEPAASRFASPSTFAEGRRGPAHSPLAAAGGLGRFRRGELIHRLLQVLPDTAPGERAATAAKMLARERDLTPEHRREMADAALSVLTDARFAEVFAPGSRAEAAVAGAAPELPEGLAISGRVDRMLVTPERVLVVDFKTNRPSPDRIEQADAAYLQQMAIYVAVLRAIFPGRRVEAALVWIDGPKLMPIPENVIDATLAGIRLGR